MPETPAVYLQTFDYYNFCVTGNFVFEYEKPPISSSYEYEENGVYYCTTGTEKGVYWYIYARNCPLMYTDPDGEFIVAAIIGAFIGAMINLAANANNIEKGWQILAYAAIGGAAGFAGGAAGGSAFSAIGVSGFAGGAIAGAAGGMANNFITGAGNAWMQGANFGQGLFAGFNAGINGGAIGGLTGGLIGGINAAAHGANFWDGSFTHYSTIPGEVDITMKEALNNEAIRSKSALAEFDNKYLATKAKIQMNFDAGDLNCTTTTNAPTGAGYSNDGYFVVNEKGSLVKASGALSGIHGKPPYAIHISEARLYSSNLLFKDTFGHELIHAYHWSVIAPGNFNKSFSETTARAYERILYYNAGANISIYTNYVPGYRIPEGLKWPIF